MVLSHDPFRAPGTRYENEEVVCIAKCRSGSPVDWSPERVPEVSIWLPEPLYAELTRSSGRLEELNPYVQNRIPPDVAAAIATELRSVQGIDEGQDLQDVIALVLPVLDQVASGEGTWDLLVEGP